MNQSLFCFGFFCIILSDSDSSENLLPISELKQQLLIEKMGEGSGGKVAQNNVSSLQQQNVTDGNGNNRNNILLCFVL